MHQPLIYIRVFNKPSSVPRSGDNHLSSPEITFRLKRHNPKGSAGSFIPFLFGLTPNGVYQANKLPYCWWALTSPFHPYRPSRRFTFLWHYPWGHPRRMLSGILPCGARTFLVCLSRQPRLSFALYGIITYPLKACQVQGTGRHVTFNPGKDTVAASC